MPNRFFDAHVRPPRGGWNFEYQGKLINGYSESEIVEAVRRVQQNNGSYVSDAAISEMLWRYYCAREPDRCGQRVSAPVASFAPGQFVVKAEVTPEIQGPGIWLFLNTLAVQWTPAFHDYFLATCDAIIVILECPDCRTEWRRLLTDYPPVSLASKLAVCHWVNDRHNDVNRKIGKQQFPYERMVSQFGAPFS